MSNLEYIVEMINRLSAEDKQYIIDKINSDNKEKYTSDLVDKNSKLHQMYENIEYESLKKKKELLSNNNYFNWLLMYCSNIKFLDSSDYYKEDISSSDKMYVEEFKNVYAGVRTYAEANNIGYYAAGGNAACYYIEYNARLFKLSLYVNGGGYTCEIIKRTDLLINEEDVISFNDIMIYYQNLDIEKVISRKRS